jgi:hypothetical protein
MKLGTLTINHLSTRRLSGILNEETHPHSFAIRWLAEQLAVSTLGPSSSIYLHLQSHLIELLASKGAAVFSIIPV